MEYLLSKILQIGAMLPAARPRGYCTVVWRGSQKRYRCLQQQPVEAGRGAFPNPHMPGITSIPVFLPIMLSNALNSTGVMPDECEIEVLGACTPQQELFHKK